MSGKNQVGSVTQELSHVTEGSNIKVAIFEINHIAEDTAV
jgi:hypothetical protein